jgi:putative DNA primase/helicase
MTDKPIDDFDENEFAQASDYAEPRIIDNAALAKEPRSDVGNARRLVARHGHDLRAVGDTRPRWMSWDDRRWLLEGSRAIAMLRAHNTADAIELEVAALEEMAARAGSALTKQDHEAVERNIAAHRRWRVASGNKSRWTGMLEAAAAMLQQTMDQLDTHPFLLNIANGTLDLQEDISRTGRFTLRLPERNQFITRLGAVAYDPNADAPRFRKFLDRIMPDLDRQLFLQRWFGYGLTGDMQEQKLLIAHGTGANGKSTLFDLILTGLADYGVTVDIKSLLHNDFKRGADASPDLARLFGRRTVVASEPEANDRLSESLIKAMTGGDRIVVRPLYQEPFEFYPTFKVNILTNTLPIIRGTDLGIWRRVLLLHFDQVIPEDQRLSKSEIIRELMVEASGILNWMLDGWLECRDGGLDPPTSVLKATERYRADSNPVGMFLQVATKLDPMAQVSATRLYQVYQKWCQANAVEPRSQKWFGDRMTDMGIRRDQVGVMYYFGIQLVREDFEEGSRTAAD